MIVYNNQAPGVVNNVGQFGATEGSIGAYKQAAEYAADAKYWALLSQTRYSSVDDILAEVERLFAQGLLLESDIQQLKNDFEEQSQVLLGLIQSTGTAIDNTNAATELSKEATQEVLAQLDIISNMTVQTTLLPPGSLATGSYDNTTGVFSFGIPEGQPGRDGTDGTISDIGSVATGTPVSDDYGFYVDKEDGGLYRTSMVEIANLVPSVRSISINGGEEQVGSVSFNSVSSFNARTGDVLPVSGDYSVDQITGAAASGINSDITSLTGLTTAISVGQGGTGASTPEEARTNLELGSVSVENIVPVLKGGTGASTPEWARTNLGLGLVATESIVPITKGGTGATSSENARLALVSAKSGDNYDITSLNNLTTALSVIQGGTGADTPDAAWLNIRPTGSTPLNADPINPLDAATKQWVENNGSNLSDSIFEELLSTSGLSRIGTPQGSTLATLVNWTTPESYGAVGDGVTDDTEAFRNACVSGFNVKGKPGSVYNLNMTEDNVIIPPEGVTIDLNGSTLVHNTTGYLVFMIRNQRVSITNGNFVYKGSYPTSAVATTRYGITRPHAAAFTGFIGLNNNAFYTLVDNIKVSGNTDANLYDFVISGYEGNFQDSKFTNIHASHYACALINNFHNTHIDNIYGTKRHNKSSNVYGPGHLLYVSLNNGHASNLFEYGSLLSNESTLGYAGATVQTTGLNGCRITNIYTTMNDVGSLSCKVGGEGFVIDTIYNKTSASVTQPQALVEIQTQSQSVISDGTITNVNVYLPDGNLSAVGYRHGGTNIKAVDVKVHATSSTTRENELVQLVTSDAGDVDVTIDTLQSDAKVLVASYNNGKANIRTISNPVVVTSGTSMGGQAWGECLKSTFSLDDNLKSSVSHVGVNGITRRQCLFEYATWSNGEFYGQVINQSTTASLAVTVPMRMPTSTATSGDFNTLVYRVDVISTSLTGIQALASSHILFIRGNGGSVTMSVSDIYVKQSAEVAIAPTFMLNANSVTVTVSRQSGGVNLRDLVVRAALINSKPYVL